MANNMNNSNEDIRDEASSNASKAKNTAKGAVRSGKKLLGRKARLTKGKVAKKMANATGKMAIKLAKILISIIKALISLLLSFWWVFLIIIALGALLWIANETEYNSVGTGDYGTNLSVKKDESEASLDNAVTLLLYTKYSTRSYYYTVDNDSTVKQASANQEIKDFENRDTMFALSPGTLFILDKYLNQGYINPEQFIKPIYNSCSTGESTDGICKLVDITNKEGELEVDSVKYKKVKDYKTDKSGKKTEIGYHYEKVNGSYEKGTWGWGLAPILHYKKFEQESKVNNYQATSFEVFDRKSGGIKSITISEYEKMSKKDKEKLKDEFGDVFKKIEDVPSSVLKGDKEDNGLIPEDDIAHAVDSVASFLGQITNALSLNWVYTDEYTNTDNPVSWNKWYNDANEEEIANKKLLKRVRRKTGQIVEGYNVKYKAINVNLTEVQKETCEKEADDAKKDAKKEGVKGKKKLQAIYDKAYASCEQRYSEVNGYSIIDKNGKETFMAGSKNEFEVSVYYSADLRVTRNGQLFKHTVTYDDDEPNLSVTSGLGYLKSYIKNYKTFIERTDVTKKKENNKNYYCKPIKDSELNMYATNAEIENDETIKKLYGAVNLDKLSATLNAPIESTTTDTRKQIMDTFKVSSTQKTQIVNKPSECARNTVAMAIDSKEKPTNLYTSSTPTVQYMGIAKELGYGVDASGSSLESISALSNSTIVETGINNQNVNGGIVGENTGSELLKTKYAKQIKSAATSYGVDINLLYAVAEVSSKGDKDFNAGKCTSSKGCGLMGIKNNVFEGKDKLTAYNYTKKTSETFAEAVANIGKSNDYMSPENNIIYAAMQLQRYLDKYENNTMVAIQTYNYGDNVMQNFINFYTKTAGTTLEYMLSDDIMYEWTAYRSYCNEKTKECFGKKGEWGSEVFIENVLSSFGTVDTISMRKRDGTYSTFDFRFLKDSTTDTETSKNKAINNRIMNMYLRKGGDEYWNKYWDVIYLNQKPFNDGKYAIHNENKGGINDLPDNADMIAYKNSKNEYDTDMIIKTIFAFNEGQDVNSYDNLSDEYWKTKYAAMFKTAGSKAWSSSYDISRTFNDAVKLPVNSPIITDDFGWKIRENTYFNYSSDTEILATKGQKVVALSSGEVVDIDKNKENSVVTIVHNDGSGKLADEDKEETEDKEEEEKDEELSTAAKSVTGTWSDTKDMGLNEEEIISIIQDKFTDLKPDSALKGQASGYVKYCKEKNVNPFLVAAISAQESGYGTSELAKSAYNFGGMKGHGNAGTTSSGWQKFTSPKKGYEAHIDLIAFYIHDWGLHLPSTMAEKYCEGSSSWVVNVNSIYATIAGTIYEEATQARHETVKKYVSFTYKGLNNIKLKKGDIVKPGDVVGYVGESDTFEMQFIDDNKQSDIAQVFRAIEDSRAREKAMLAFSGGGGTTGANNIGVDINTPSFTTLNPYGYVGQCTWYVWGRLNQVTKKSLPGFGNANTWCEDARRAGYKTGSTPSVNSIIVWGGGQYGHVAFVEEYKKDGTITFSEGNYNNPCNYAANNCDMVAYAQRNPGKLLHKTTLSTEETKNYIGMNFKCFVYTTDE